MTVALGFVDEGNAYLVVDSAVTGGWGPFEETSSFGEKSVLDPERVVEGAAKLMKLDSSTCAAMIGDGVEAERFLIRVRAALGSNSLERAIKSSFVDVPRGSRFACLLATSSPEPMVIRANSRGEQRRLAGPSVLGSLPAEARTFVDRLPHQARRMGPTGGKGYDADRCLAAAVASMQAFGQRADLMQRRVGGAFFGVRVDREGVHWQRDIFFIVAAAEDLLAKNLVLGQRRCKIAVTCVREDTLVVWSSEARGFRGFANSMSQVTEADAPHWFLKHFAAVPPVSPEVRFYVVIEPNTGALALIDSHGKRPQFFLSLDEHELRIEPALVQVVGTWPPLGPDGRPPAEVPMVGLSEP